MRRAVVLAALAAASASAQTPAPPVCTTPDHAALDFWVGDWDVYKTGGDNPVARSLIERLYDGCAIRENWMPIGKTGGGSLSSYDADTRKWRQLWIDASGQRVEFEGGRSGDTVVLEGPWRHVNGPNQHATVRMTYTPAQDGSVRQHGVASADGGKSWQPSFDFTYRRRPAASAAP